jgi:hypothetical protein
MSDYPGHLDEAIRTAQSNIALKRLLEELNSPEHKLTRLGQGDHVLRLAVGKLLRAQGRSEEGNLLEHTALPIHISTHLEKPLVHQLSTEVTSHLDSMERQYLATALWSTNDESDERGGEPLDQNHGIEDIEPESLGKLLSSVHHFRESLPPHLREAVDSDPGQAGHDIWLTQHRHGSGFSDGDWDEHGDELAEHAQRLPEHNLHAFNGQVHCD